MTPFAPADAIARAALPQKRKQPRIVNRWYLTLYLRHQPRWTLWLGAATIGFSLVSSALDLFEQRRQFSLWIVAALVGWTLASLLKDVIATRRSIEEASGGRLQPLPAEDMAHFLEAVALPPELLEAGYRKCFGGHAVDVLKRTRFAGCSVYSPEVSRLLRERSARGLPVARFEPAPGAQRWPALGRWVGRWSPTFARGAWNFPLWAVPELSRRLQIPVVSALPAYTSGRLANEQKLRLCDDLTPAGLRGDPVLHVQRTDYLSDLVTGHITGIEVLDAAGHPMFDGVSTGFKRSARSDELRPLAQSSTSGQLGVSVMALGVSRTAAGEAQGHLYFVGQSLLSLASGGMLAPSGSGSLDWSDYTEAGDRFIEMGMLREMLEETWVGNWSSLTGRRGLSIVVTGHARMLHRGGKPEFYGLAVMPRGGDEHGVDDSEYEYSTETSAVRLPALSAQGLRDAVSTVMARHASNLSHPLFMALHFLDALAAEDPGLFEGMVAHALAAAPGSAPASALR